MKTFHGALTSRQTGPDPVELQVVRQLAAPRSQVVTERKQLVVGYACHAKYTIDEP